MYQKEAAGVLDQILGHIAFYCEDNKLPSLTAIVVGKNRGTPGADIPIPQGEIDREKEKVYSFDWYNVHPPLPEQLAESFARPR